MGNATTKKSLNCMIKAANGSYTDINREEDQFAHRQQQRRGRVCISTVTQKAKGLHTNSNTEGDGFAYDSDSEEEGFAYRQRQRREGFAYRQQHGRRRVKRGK